MPKPPKSRGPRPPRPRAGAGAGAGAGRPRSSGPRWPGPKSDDKGCGDERRRTPERGDERRRAPERGGRAAAPKREERPQAGRPARPARERPQGARSDQSPRERPPRRAAEAAPAKPQRQRRAAAFRGEAPDAAADRPQRKRRAAAFRGETPAPAPAKPQRQRRAAAFRGEAAAPPAEPPRRFVAGEPQRIAKLLARAGIASRREIERMIAERRIAIEGVPIDTPATILTSLKGVSVDGRPVQAAAATRLFLFHKPTGYITAERDPAGRPTIYDRLPADLPRLMPVGRLDLNTEGLLLLTNDGELKRQLELPRTGVERAYRARVFGDISQAELEQLIHGVEVEGMRYGAIDANLERSSGRNKWIEVKLTEGKNREVRRVLEHLGLQVSRLIRIAYGPFILADLPPGAVLEVPQHDLAVFRKTLGKRSSPAFAGEGDHAKHGGGARAERALGAEEGRSAPPLHRPAGGPPPPPKLGRS